MSRIHDALRLGRSPARPLPAGRTAQVDAVLAALGYKSDRPRRPNTGIVVGSVLLVALAGGVWWMLPTTVAPPKPARPAAPRASAPAPEKASVLPPKPPQDVTPHAPAPATATPPIVEAPKPAPAMVSAPAIIAPPPGHTIEAPTSAPAAPQARIARTKGAPSPAAGLRSPRPQASDAAEPATKEEDFRLALYYQRSGDFEQALVHYKAVLQRDELNVEAHNNVGNLYMSKSLYDDAAREFRRVVAVEPKYVTAHVNLSAALYQMKKYDEAAVEARAAIRLDARNDDAYVNLGLAQAAEGQPSDARASLTRALDIDKHNSAAHYNLALQYEKAGEIALALDHYRAFLQYAGPDQASYTADVRLRVQALETRREAR